MTNAFGTFTASLYFTFEVDGYHFGQFTRLEGFTMALDHEVRQVATPSDTMHVFPGRTRYSNFRLTRPLSTDSTTFLEWMNSATGFIGRIGVLRALNPDMSVVMTWNLEGVLPVSWSGPSYDVLTAPAVASETLEFAYKGFLPMGGNPSSGSAAKALSGKLLGIDAMNI